MNEISKTNETTTYFTDSIQVIGPDHTCHDIRSVSHEGDLWFAVVDIAFAAGAGKSNSGYMARKAAPEDILEIPRGRRWAVRFVNPRGLHTIAQMSQNAAIKDICEQLLEASQEVLSDDAVIEKAMEIMTRRVEAQRTALAKDEQLLGLLAR